MSDTLPTTKPGDRVLEIVNWDTGEVARRSIVTGQSDRQVERLERGMLRNMDRENWGVLDRVVEH